MIHSPVELKRHFLDTNKCFIKEEKREGRRESQERRKVWCKGGREAMNK